MARVAPGGPPRVTLVTPAALAAELRTIAELLAPLEAPRVAAAARSAARELFEAYVRALTDAFARHAASGGPGAGARLQPLVAPLMEAVAALIETAVPAALAPLEARHGPAADARAMERALQAMYSACGAACRQQQGGGGAGGGSAGGGGSGRSSPARRPRRQELEEEEQPSDDDADAGGGQAGSDA